ncbi:DNA processing protein [Herbaspirillum sp. Sphag1AN]|uniref:DNA-processing protein DprA n=1 Tax=unclassified Herbaspirillum TaxID=2624150 RepID=UPI00160E4486|nr:MULTISPECIES: DNA-processing protein DprA [unclassified Herbaspirillum]MBB3213602.1 DNA processing protein [Herbaspirillum sp. Sphag1AN]MBB3246800.1 DNA processing protein [Herbaspirillum sp. Sphag64]
MAVSEQDKQLNPWLQLCLRDGVSISGLRRLLTQFEHPSMILQASARRLGEIVSEAQVNVLTAPVSASLQQRVDKALDWAALPGHRIMTIGDPDYPPLLRHIADPPILLYLKGCTELLSTVGVAVVGSRNATAQGLLHAERFSQAMSEAGVVVISGLALGIDAAAHEGALRGIGGTVAVLGTGIDISYPQRNIALAQRLAESGSGCIVSEYPLGMPPLAANFPRRNRIISGLARAVLVVEAAARSGSLITARMAAEQGRDVLAIPGSIHAPLSKGCHLLIKQGAKLAESIDDILSELGQLPLPNNALAKPHDPSLLPGIDEPLLNFIGFDPIDVDSLSARSAMDAANLHARLLMLELEGLVEALPGGRYRRLQ